MLEKIFFYCCPSSSPDRQAYQHAIICLAEGLSLLSVPFYANQDYWRMSPQNEEYLFNCDPDVGPDDCTIVIVDSEWVTSGRDLPGNLFHPSRRYITAYFEIGDLIQSDQARFRSFDLILRGSYNNKLFYHSNVHPWAYGLSQRIIAETDRPSEYAARQNSLLINFRHNRHAHTVRRYVDKYFVPKISRVLSVDATTDDVAVPPTEPYHYMQWSQTGRRHYPQYYQRLRTAKAVATFGGFFTPSWPKNPGNLVSRMLKRFLNKTRRKSSVIVQWDSWRFWEALSSGCATFHVNLSKYGCQLPVMPENGRHYFGIDFDDIGQTIDLLEANPNRLGEIATEGKKWALDNYAPKPVAERFLELARQCRRVKP